MPNEDYKDIFDFETNCEDSDHRNEFDNFGNESWREMYESEKQSKDSKHEEEPDAFGH